MATGGGDGDREADGELNKLTCAICLERYRRPKLLPCFHSFCQGCLQGLAGSAPTLHCPACRIPTLLPPGGVSALQTNFYIDDNPDSSGSSPQRRLCDLCTEDRDATHTCLQCQQRFCQTCRKCHDGLKVLKGHSMVPLTQEDSDGLEKGGAQSDKPAEPETCPKHPDQRVCLHCKPCGADICVQCKLTQHEGHPTEDLANRQSRARSRLQDVLGSVTQRKQRFAHLIRALEHRRDALQQQQRQTQQNLEGRADTLRQWVDLSLAEAQTSMQDTARDVERPLEDQLRQLQGRQRALQATQDHLTRVLRDGGQGEEVMALQDQLDSSLLEDKAEDTDLSHLEQQLATNIPELKVQHTTTAVSQVQLRQFIGVMQPAQPALLPLPSQAQAGSTASAHGGSSLQCAAGPGTKKELREFIYSQNPRSSVIAMCPISQSRLWVMYRPAQGASVMLKLFDADGKVLATVHNAQPSTGMVSITDDTLLSWNFDDDWVALISDGEVTKKKLDSKVALIIPCASSNKHCLRFIGRSQLSQIKFSVTGKLMYSELSIFCQESPRRQISACVSSEEEYAAFAVDNEVKVLRKDSTDHSSVFSSYNLSKKQPTDVRFCKVDDQELLLVVVDGDNRIHVVDHTDGGQFLRYLDTGTLTLDRPQRLATDFDQHLWIGCNGGKVVMIDM